MIGAFIAKRKFKLFQSSILAGRVETFQPMRSSSQRNAAPCGSAASSTLRGFSVLALEQPLDDAPCFCEVVRRELEHFLVRQEKLLADVLHPAPALELAVVDRQGKQDELVELTTDLVTFGTRELSPASKLQGDEEHLSVRLDPLQAQGVVELVEMFFDLWPLFLGDLGTSVLPLVVLEDAADGRDLLHGEVLCAIKRCDPQSLEQGVQPIEPVVMISLERLLRVEDALANPREKLVRDVHRLSHVALELEDEPEKVGLVFGALRVSDVDDVHPLVEGPRRSRSISSRRASIRSTKRIDAEELVGILVRREVRLHHEGQVLEGPALRLALGAQELLALLGDALTQIVSPRRFELVLADLDDLGIVLLEAFDQSLDLRKFPAVVPSLIHEGTIRRIEVGEPRPVAVGLVLAVPLQVDVLVLHVYGDIRVARREAHLHGLREVLSLVADRARLPFLEVSEVMRAGRPLVRSTRESAFVGRQDHRSPQLSFASCERIITADPLQ